MRSHSWHSAVMFQLFAAVIIMFLLHLLSPRAKMVRHEALSTCICNNMLLNVCLGLTTHANSFLGPCKWIFWKTLYKLKIFGSWSGSNVLTGKTEIMANDVRLGVCLQDRGTYGQDSAGASLANRTFHVFTHKCTLALPPVPHLSLCCLWFVKTRCSENREASMRGHYTSWRSCIQSLPEKNWGVEGH